MGDGKKAPWTPGPWRLDDQSAHSDLLDDEYHGIDAGDGFSGPGFEITAFMSLADARLIAAAPDLAEAALPFEAIDIDHMADLPDDDRILYFKDGIRLGDLRAARAALSLARGEKPAPATLLNVETKEPEL